MAGVKGKSGRRSNADEGQKLKVLRLAWDTIEKQLGPESELSVVQRVDIAKSLVVKNIPTELAGELGLRPIMMGTIKVNGVEAEFDIGTKPEDAEDEGTPEDPESTSEATTSN